MARASREGHVCELCRPKPDCKPGDPLGVIMSGGDGCIRLFDISKMPAYSEIMVVSNMFF